MRVSPHSPLPVRVHSCGTRRAVGLLALVAAQAMVIPLALPGGNAVAAPQATTDSGSTVPSAQTRNRAPIDVDGWLTRLKARQMQAQPEGKALFAGISWQPPPRPEARTLPPPPQMPVFPYQVIGLVSVGGNVLLALEQKGNAHAVRVGDVIESFRIERIGEDSFVVFHASTGKTREYRYDELAPVATSAAPATSGILAPLSITTPSLQGPQGTAQPAPPAANAARAAAAAGNAMVPMGGVTTPVQAGGPAAAPLAPLGGVIAVPSVRETRPPWPRADPTVAPPQR